MCTIYQFVIYPYQIKTYFARWNRMLVLNKHLNCKDIRLHPRSLGSILLLFSSFLYLSPGFQQMRLSKLMSLFVAPLLLTMLLQRKFQANLANEKPLCINFVEEFTEEIESSCLFFFFFGVF